MFWTFDQNNSGGSFIVDEDVAHYVIIEAEDMKKANELGESIGLYYDGSGDCACCGRRWSEQWDEEDGTTDPMIYGEPVQDFRSWMPKVAIIYYLDGRKERFELPSSS